MFENGQLILATGVSFLSGIIWLVRLEGKLNQNYDFSEKNKREIDDLRHKHEALDARIMEKLSVIERSLARIEGRLESSGLGTR